MKHSQLLILLPVLLPLLGAILTLPFLKFRMYQRTVFVLFAIAALVSSGFLLMNVTTFGITSLSVGSWQAPFGIAFVADTLSALMVVIAGVLAVAISIYSIGAVDSVREKFGYYPLMLMLLMGINGSFLTGDIFNLYVWFEVMLISSFVLIALGNTRDQLEGAMKYVTINLVSSFIFLISAGVLYGMVGTLNMADLSVRLQNYPDKGVVNLIAMLMMISFGVKSAVFPLFAWLPASYHTPPITISAFFAGLLTKVGVYALLRVFTLIFVQDTQLTHSVLLVIAVVTMVVGVFGAAIQMEIRKILSFHIVSQIGYMIMGLAIFTPLAIAGTVFYITHHIIVKTNLFLVGGIIRRYTGSYQLKQIGGLYKKKPLIGLLFLIPALSLAGLPPLSGFWAKFLIIKSGLEASQFTASVIALLVSILTLYSMMKIWNEAFWKDAPKDPDPLPAEIAGRSPLWLIVPAVMLAAITIAIGFYTEPFVQLATNAANELLNRNGYIEAVLGKGVVP